MHGSLTSFVSSPAVRLLRLTVAVVHTVQHDQRKWEQTKLHLGGCMIVPTHGRKRQRYSPRACKVRIWDFNMYIFPQRSGELRSPDWVVSHIRGEEKTPSFTTGYCHFRERNALFLLLNVSRCCLWRERKLLTWGWVTHTPWWINVVCERTI